MKLRTIKLSQMKAILLTLGLMASSTVFAQVDVNTSDEVLLKGKNLDKMYDVAVPSARMEFVVEGVDKPIPITFDGATTLLDASGLTNEEKSLVHSTYVKFSGSSNVDFLDANGYTKAHSKAKK